jgi:glycosyltransferase involved in cell wall biosynthesis
MQTLSMPNRAWRQRRVAPDLWHVLDGSRAFIASALASRPRVVTMHDIIPWLQGSGHLAQVGRAGAAARKLWQRNAASLRAVEQVLCVSEATRNDVVSHFGVDSARASVLHLPLRPDLAALVTAVAEVPRRRGRVLHVGNNAAYKNRVGVLRLFARLPVDLALELAMCGPAPTPELRQLAAELGITDRVEWITDLEDNRLAQEYAQASLLTYPSLYEGFGWPPLEAMAFGVPVVSSDAPALREVVGNAAPSLPISDERAWEKACIELLASSVAAASASARGRKRAADFCAAAFAEALRDVYLRTASGARQ